MRTPEQIAPGTLAELLTQLAKLTTDQPATKDIEKALTLTVPAITMALADWIRDRHTIQANAHRAGVIPIASPEEDEALDGIEEAQRIDRAHVHPVFALLTTPFLCHKEKLG